MSKPKTALDTAVMFFKKTIVWMIAGLIILPVGARASEAMLQVAFVYNFIKFIDWPIEGDEHSLKLCVLGANKEMHDALDQLNGKTSNKQVIELVYLNANNIAAHPIETCQMLFNTSPLESITLPHPLPKGVVLVASEQAVNNDNASIVFKRSSEGRIEFEINQPAVNQAGIKISSQLLKLAKNSQAGRY